MSASAADGAEAKPDQHAAGEGSQTAWRRDAVDGSVRLLVVFRATHHTFRLPEMDAAAASLGATLSYDRSHNIDTSPYVLVDFPSVEVACQICARTVGIKRVLEVWGCGATHDGVVESFRGLPPAYTTIARDTERSFRMTVAAYGKKVNAKAQRKLIYRYAALDFEGPVNLDAPDDTYWVIEDWGAKKNFLEVVDADTVRAVLSEGVDGSDEASVAAQVAARWEAVSELATEPRLIWFGRQVCADTLHPLIHQYELTKRPYLGTTSMDCELSFLMALQACAEVPGSLVLDPFVGTGSIILTAAALGASVMGFDIDPKPLRGWDRRYTDRDVVRRDVWANFEAFDLRDHLVDLLLHDNAHSAVRPGFQFDAIVADPPYGVRAGAKKVGSRPDVAGGDADDGEAVDNGEHSSGGGADQSGGPAAVVNDMFPNCVLYSVDEVVVDLLEFAVDHLAVGGRLVYWLPTTIEYTDRDLPQHPCLDLVANSEQILSLYFRRRLITMVKVCDPSDLDDPSTARVTVAASLGAALGGAGGGNDSSGPAHANLREKLFSPTNARPTKKAMRAATLRGAKEGAGR